MVSKVVVGQIDETLNRWWLSKVCKFTADIYDISKNKMWNCMHAAVDKHCMSVYGWVLEGIHTHTHRHTQYTK